MSFIWSSLLVLLILVPVLAFMYYRMQQRRKKFVEQSGFGLVQSEDTSAASNRTGMRRHLPALIFLLGITILIFSLARPRATVSLPKYEGTVILVFDVSGSMAADDVAPSRLEAAKAVANQFVEDEPAAVRIGVVAFSDGGLTVQTPDVNRTVTLSTIERLVPRRGTSLGNGVLVALNTIAVDAGDPPIINTSTLSTADDVLPTPQGWYPSAVVLLFSDGENNQNPDPLMVTDLATDLGVRIYTVGVGSRDGTTIKVDGMNIHTALDESVLGAIAETSGGQYYYAGDENNLRRVYSDLEPTLSIKPEELELTSLLAGIAMLTLLWGGALSLLWFGRVP